MHATMPTTKKTSAAAGKPRTAADALDRFDFQSDSLGYALRRAQVRAYGLFFEMLGALELSPARLTALSTIAMETDINQATLARRLNIAGPSALKLIDALEDAGFIRRKDVANDRRSYSLALTAPGKAMLDTLRANLAAYEARLASRLTAAEREQLLALLSRVAS